MKIHTHTDTEIPNKPQTLKRFSFVLKHLDLIYVNWSEKCDFYIIMKNFI